MSDVQRIERSSAMNKVSPIIYGILGVMRRNGRVLMIQRSKHVRAPLAWCFPGGQIEPGETQAEALVREIREEVHLEVQPGELLYTQTKHDGRLVLYAWSAEILAGEPIANPREIAEVAWMTGEEIRVKTGVLVGTTEILDAIGI